VIEEADETAFWLELLTEAEFASPNRLCDVTAEAMQLVRIFVASRETAKKGVQSRINSRQSKLSKREVV
jgi:hypothetical protein